MGRSLPGAIVAELLPFSSVTSFKSHGLAYVLMWDTDFLWRFSRRSSCGDDKQGLSVLTKDCFAGLRRGFALLFVVALILLISGCGGGSGGGSNPVSGNGLNAVFTATPLSGTVPLLVQLDASASTSAAAGSIDSYRWSFGDGQTAMGVSTSHTYLSTGFFSVTLTVTDNQGATASTSQLVSVAGVTLSGTVSTAVGSVIDSDINDPNFSNTPNNDYLNAQSLPNPVTLGGYLNVAGTGSSGSTAVAGDTSDFYRLNLIAGQTITVTIADTHTGNLDLYLYHDPGGGSDPMAPDYFSMGTGQVESLTVPTSGDYYIEVRALAGFSNYSLVVGQIAPQHIDGRLVSTDEFVPGDVVVKFRDDPKAGALSAMQAPSLRAAALGLQAKAGNDHRRPQLMGLGAPQARMATFGALGGVQPLFKFSDPEKQLKFETMQVIQALRQRSDVEYAEPNFIRRASAVPVDQFYPFQWHYPLISLPSAWDVSKGVATVTVAVVDTGVLLNHPDLMGQFSSDGGYDFIADDANSGDGEPGIDANPNDPGDSGGLGSSSFHGTHVAGTVAAATAFPPTASSTGVAGVAPGVKIMPLRVLGQLGGTGYDVMQAVLYAAGLSNDSGITLSAAERADVINLSLGGGGYSQMEQDAYTAARNQEVIIVAAAGNENSSVASYPAAYAGVVSVSAIDINKQRAPYSNFGATVDVAAPGGDTSVDLNGDGYVDGVLSPLADDSGALLDYNYTFYQGTSMATPHVAGVVALMKSVHSALTPVELDIELQNGTIVEDLGATGRDDIFGHGMINAHSAVVRAQTMATGAPTPTPLLGASPASLNIGSVGTSALLNVSNVGNGTLTVDAASVTAGNAWLSVAAESVDAAGLGTYRVTINRGALADGSYQGTVSFTSTPNTVDVPVLMQVGAQASTGDVGYQYVLLLDALDFTPLGQWEGMAVNGRYQYQFNDVSFSAGQEYFIMAGSDLNNDFFICDPGEACGAYFSLGSMRTVDSSGPFTGLDFMAGFDAGIQINSTEKGAQRSPGVPRLPATQQRPGVSRQ